MNFFFKEFDTWKANIGIKIILQEINKKDKVMKLKIGNNFIQIFFNEEWKPMVYFFFLI